MLFSTLNFIFFWIFVTVNSVFVAGVLIGLIRHYKSSESLKSVAIKGVISLSVWIVLTAVMIVAAASYFYADTISEKPRVVKFESATIYFIGYFIIWILSVIFVIYWANRAGKKKLM